MRDALYTRSPPLGVSLLGGDGSKPFIPKEGSRRIGVSVALEAQVRLKNKSFHF